MPDPTDPAAGRQSDPVDPVAGLIQIPQVPPQASVRSHRSHTQIPHLDPTLRPHTQIPRSGPTPRPHPDPVSTQELFGPMASFPYSTLIIICNFSVLALVGGTIVLRVRRVLMSEEQGAHRRELWHKLALLPSRVVSQRFGLHASSRVKGRRGAWGKKRMGESDTPNLLILGHSSGGGSGGGGDGSGSGGGDGGGTCSAVISSQI